jgi:hypothetical protein
LKEATKWGENIKMELKEILWEIVDGIFSLKMGNGGGLL